MSSETTDDLSHLLEQNRQWAERMEGNSPGFFRQLADQQKPEYLWIGCSDSRVPANQIIGLLPGEVFVHRNLANVVLHTDVNCLAVVEFAVKVLQVRHIILCGHLLCGGVEAAMKGEAEGLVGNWLRNIRDLYEARLDELGGLDDGAALARLCEINVKHQLRSLCQTSILREAWSSGQDLTAHGWVYSIEDGLLQDLALSVSSLAEASELDRIA